MVTDSRGYVEAYKPYYSIKDGFVNSNPTAIHAKDPIISGIMAKNQCADGKIKINCGATSRTMRVTTSIPVIFYDLERDIITVGTMADVEVGDYILTKFNWSSASSFVVYR